MLKRIHYRKNPQALQNAYLPRCTINLIAQHNSNIYASLFGFLRALHLSIPYQVRDKLLSSLPSRVFFNTPLGMNKDRREKDTDARRWRRCIDYPRLDINSFPVTIRPALLIAAVVISPSSVLIAAIVTSFHTFMVISGEGRRYIYTADH
jgi:hypothetical protein